MSERQKVIGEMRKAIYRQLLNPTPQGEKSTYILEGFTEDELWTIEVFIKSFDYK